MLNKELAKNRKHALNVLLQNDGIVYHSKLKQIGLAILVKD